MTVFKICYKIIDKKIYDNFDAYLPIYYLILSQKLHFIKWNNVFNQFSCLTTYGIKLDSHLSVFSFI